jgi:hypothetical protein
MQMKFNWKVLVAVILMVGAAFWALDSNRARSYNGTNLTFPVGTGPVIVTNPSDASIPAQLVGKGSRSFSVVSNIEGLAGTSSREGNGSSATQTFAFELAPGTTELSINRGSDVNLVTATDTRLDAVVQPVNASQATTNLLMTGAIMLGLLYFISFTTDHQWLRMLRQQPVTPTVVLETSGGGQGKSAKSYGDNRV